MDPIGPTDEPLSRRLVLLVDDNEDAATSMARLLAFWGFHVQIARDATSALDALASCPPDVLITDLALPDQDGRVVSKTARTLPKPPLCLLVTGWPVDDEPSALEAIGVDRLFPKPVDFQKLHDYLFPGGRPE